MFDNCPPPPHSKIRSQIIIPQDLRFLWKFLWINFYFPFVWIIICIAPIFRKRNFINLFWAFTLSCMSRVLYATEDLFHFSYRLHRLIKFDFFDFSKKKKNGTFRCVQKFKSDSIFYFGWLLKIDFPTLILSLTMIQFIVPEFFYNQIYIHIQKLIFYGIKIL